MGALSVVQAIIISRSKFHAKRPGQLLYGWTIYDCPDPEEVGESGLPAARIYVLDFSETAKNKTITAASKIVIEVATNRTKGNVEHLEAIEKFMDALRTHENGSPDQYLNGTICFPLVCASSKQFIVDLSLNTSLSLNIAPRAYQAGAMRE